jgi:hypothetical protein
MSPGSPAAAIDSLMTLVDVFMTIGENEVNQDGAWWDWIAGSSDGRPAR